MFQDILLKSFFQNTVEDYLTTLVLIAAGFLGVWVLKAVVIKSVKRWSERTSTELDDFLIHIFEKTLLPLFYFAVFYFSVRSLTLPSGALRALYIVGVIILTVQGIRLVTALAEYAIRRYWIREGVGVDERAKSRFKGLLPALKVIIWGIGTVFLLDNMGFEISAVIAGLGIGGIAVALASQAVLGDLFNYFAILLDRPFEVGDFIIVGDYMGTVEHVGVKTTRIKSLGGEQLVFSNTDLTGSRVRNYKRMERRRVVFRIGVTYETGLDRLTVIPGVIKKIITGVEGTAFDRSHFATYGESDLVFETVYYVTTGDYTKYMDIQQAINLGIKEEFDALGVGFAYPTRTVYVNKT